MLLFLLELQFWLCCGNGSFLRASSRVWYVMWGRKGVIYGGLDILSAKILGKIVFCA